MNRARGQGLHQFLTLVKKNAVLCRVGAPTTCTSILLDNCIMYYFIQKEPTPFNFLTFSDGLTIVASLFKLNANQQRRPLVKRQF